MNTEDMFHMVSYFGSAVIALFPTVGQLLMAAAFSLKIFTESGLRQFIQLFIGMVRRIRQYITAVVGLVQKLL